MKLRLRLHYAPRPWPATPWYIHNIAIPRYTGGRLPAPVTPRCRTPREAFEKGLELWINPACLEMLQLFNEWARSFYMLDFKWFMASRGAMLVDVDRLRSPSLELHQAMALVNDEMSPR